MADFRIEDAARAACLELGLMPPNHYDRNKFHIVDVEDGKPGNGAGRIKIFADGKAGIAHNWRTGEKRSFFVRDDASQKPLTKAERRRIKSEKKRIQAERLRRLKDEEAKHDKAALRAAALWQKAQPAPQDHPYLIAKCIQPHGARVGRWLRVIRAEDGTTKSIAIENALILPLFDAAGRIRSLQAIFPEPHPLLNRSKDFLPSGGLSGLFWWIGSKSKRVLVCEGFATGATLHEQTGDRVYLAYTANNLMNVAQIVRERLPDTDIVLCADNDSSEGNPGLTKATAAALAIDGRLAVPPIWGDFNDWVNQGGAL